MVPNERFFAFMKLLLHRIADLDTRISAIQIVLRVNYAPDFVEKVRAVSQDIEERPESKAYREAVDTLELAEVLDVFEKYHGPVQ